MSRVTVSVAVAFGYGPNDSPPASAWVDLSDRVRSDVAGGPILELDRGGEDEASQPGASVAAVWLDNVDGQLDPAASTASWADDLRPMTPASIDVDVDGELRRVFSGVVESWPAQAIAGEHDAYVPATFVDATKRLGRSPITVDRPAERTDTRVDALLDAAGWPGDIEDRDLDVGVVRLEATEYVDEDALDALRDTADAEGGKLWFGPLGQAILRNRHARLAVDDGDDDPALRLGVGGLPVEVLRANLDDDGVVNDARVELEDGRRLGAVDDDSIARYGRVAAPTFDLPVADAEAEGLALWAVARWAEPVVRVDPVDVPARAAGVLGDLLDLELGDLVEVARPAGDGVDELLCHVEGIRHAAAAGSWTTTLSLTPYYGDGPWLRLVDESDEPAGAPPLDTGVAAP